MKSLRWVACMLATRLVPGLVARFLSSRLRPAELGDLGEELVARRLRKEGWNLIARRLGTPMGEIDIVARRSGVLACVEVKTGRGSPGDLRWRPGLHLDGTTLARQHRSARWLARRLGKSGECGRVDLHEVFLEHGRWPRFLTHPDLRQPLTGQTVIHTRRGSRGAGA